MGRWILLFIFSLPCLAVEDTLCTPLLEGRDIPADLAPPVAAKLRLDPAQARGIETKRYLDQMKALLAHPSFEPSELTSHHLEKLLVLAQDQELEGALRVQAMTNARQLFSLREGRVESSISSQNLVASAEYLDNLIVLAQRNLQLILGPQYQELGNRDYPLRDFFQTLRVLRSLNLESVDADRLARISDMIHNALTYEAFLPQSIVFGWQLERTNRYLLQYLESTNAAHPQTMINLRWWASGVGLPGARFFIHCLIQFLEQRGATFFDVLPAAPPLSLSALRQLSVDLGEGSVLQEMAHRRVTGLYFLINDMVNWVHPPELGLEFLSYYQQKLIPPPK
jgi:hypothetical protein